ncbi:MAG: hypothetical protein ACE5M4_05360, partial [Anaerolineales bacterium]
WPRLREWLDEDREGLRIHRHLTEAAQAWEALERDLGELYRGGRLAQALEWLAEQQPELNPLEREFLEASQELAQQREAEREAQLKRLRRRAIYLVGALIAAVGLAFVAVSFGRQASTSAGLAEQSLSTAQVANTEVVAESSIRATAEAVAVEERSLAEEQVRLTSSREIAAAAMANLDRDSELSALLAIEALEIEYTAEAENSLHQAVSRLRLHQLFEQPAQGSEPFTITYDPSGTQLVTGNFDGSISVWEIETGNEIAHWSAHPNFIEEVEFSPDGSVLASVSTDSQEDFFKLWDLSPVEKGLPAEEIQAFHGHTEGPWDVAFTPDGKRIVSTSDDFTTRIWDVLTGQELLKIEDGGIAVDIPPYGGIVVTAGLGVETYDLETGEMLHKLPGYPEGTGVSMVRFSPDGRLLATGGWDGILKVWQFEPNDRFAPPRLLFSTAAHANQFFGISFNVDATRLATSGQDGVIKVWEPLSGTELLRLAGDFGGSNEVAFDPACIGQPEFPFETCGRFLASTHAFGPIRIWDVSQAGGGELASLPGFFARFGGQDSSVRTLRPLDLANPNFFDYQMQSWKLTDSDIDRSQEGDSSAIASLSISRDITESEREVMSFGQSPDLNAFVYDDFTIRITSYETGKEIARFPLTTHTDFGWRPSFSNDGRWVIVPAQDNSAKVWDIATGSELYSLQIPGAPIMGTDFSPDDSMILTGGMDGTITLWESQTAHEIWSILGHDDWVYAADFTSDGQRVATGSRDTTAKIWDTQTGEELVELQGHTASVNFVDFSPDDLLLATSSVDGSVKVWDLETGTQRLSFGPYSGATTAAEFSPDGTRLLSSSETYFIVRVYALPIDEVVQLARSRLSRSLTTAECQQYLHIDKCP